MSTDHEKFKSLEYSYYPIAFYCGAIRKFFGSITTSDNICLGKSLNSSGKNIGWLNLIFILYCKEMLEIYTYGYFLFFIILEPCLPCLPFCLVFYLFNKYSPYLFDILLLLL